MLANSPGEMEFKWAQRLLNERMVKDLLAAPVHHSNEQERQKATAEDETVKGNGPDPHSILSVYLPVEDQVNDEAREPKGHEQDWSAKALVFVRAPQRDPAPFPKQDCVPLTSQYRAAIRNPQSPAASSGYYAEFRLPNFTSENHPGSPLNNSGLGITFTKP